MADACSPLTWRCFHLPKKGHTAQEYEDAFAGDVERGRFAVADGASESGFAGLWARILVKAFVQFPGPWSTWLPAARKRWRTVIDNGDLPWFAEAKAQEGAFATLLGISFGKGRWEAEAVGDTCLFHVRESRVRLAFPLRRSADFSNQPVLLGSRPKAKTMVRSNRARVRGDWQPRDMLYLMTDALAHWFLAKTESRGTPWKDLEEFQTLDSFTRWVEKIRQGGEVRNDDMTLIRIQEKR